MFSVPVLGTDIFCKPIEYSGKCFVYAKERKVSTFPTKFVCVECGPVRKVRLGVHNHI